MSVVLAALPCSNRTSVTNLWKSKSNNAISSLVSGGSIAVGQLEPENIRVCIFTQRVKMGQGSPVFLITCSSCNWPTPTSATPTHSQRRHHLPTPYVKYVTLLWVVEGKNHIKITAYFPQHLRDLACAVDGHHQALNSSRVLIPNCSLSPPQMTCLPGLQSSTIRANHCVCYYHMVQPC